MQDQSQQNGEDIKYEDRTREGYVAILVFLQIPLLIAAVGGTVWLASAPFLFGLSSWAFLGAFGAAIASLILIFFVWQALTDLRSEPIVIHGTVGNLHEVLAAGGGGDYYLFSVNGIEFESETIYPHLFNGAQVTLTYWPSSRDVESVTVQQRRNRLNTK